MDVKAIWKEVQENQKKIRTCKRHYFGAVGPLKLGQKLTCQNCGGVMNLVDVGSYIRGYEAAGGAATDIISDWRSEAKV